MRLPKLLIAAAVLFTAARSAQAQSVLEDLMLESAITTSILQEQVGSGTSEGFVVSSGEAPIGPQQFNSTEPNGTSFDDILTADVAATPEPSPLLLFGIGVLAAAFYRRNRMGYWKSKR